VRDADGRPLRASILDFKTDRFDTPEERAAIETRYAPQLEAYREAMTLLCPQLNTASITASLAFVIA
jgi:ATP-dependent exoDNAse (exonuclease V) beta subunit